MHKGNVWPIGVFASIDAGLGVHLNVASELGISTIQLHAPKPSSRTPERAKSFLSELSDLGIQLTAVFGGFDGESYADIPTVEQTVGLVPPATQRARLDEMKKISDFAKMLECNVIALHLGFVPHDPASSGWADIVAVTQELCDHAAANGQDLHLETGQETADNLIQFMDGTARPNLYVNFDPANMILYGTGEPIEALQRLGARVHSVHCKDAIWAKSPGKEWGREVAFGRGDVNALQFLQTLWDLGYRGPLTIEREIPHEPDRQRAEIASAVSVINQLSREVQGLA